MENETTCTEVNYFMESSKQVDTWPLMGSPIYMILIVSSYLVFVLKLGPELMKDKKPMNIKSIILVYNLYQTISNAHIVAQLFINEGVLTYLWHHACIPMDPRMNKHWHTMNYATWFYLLSKIVDLLDTIFFVLRKKQSHITFLHVYHHANMVVMTWIYLKYIKGEQAVIIGVLNSFVHVVMYSYYFLAALGPSVQKYLWWKKYITRLQMVQFAIFFVYMMSVIVLGCPFPRILTIVTIVQSIVFFILFLNFYLRTYTKKPKADQVKEKSEVEGKSE